MYIELQDFSKFDIYYIFSEDLVLAEERTSKKDRQRIMEGKYFYNYTIDYRYGLSFFHNDLLHIFHLRNTIYSDWSVC